MTMMCCLRPVIWEGKSSFISQFSGIGPSVLTRLFHCFYLSLYGAALWSLSSPSIQALEVSFNKLLRQIWRLPARSHTTIVHHIALFDRVDTQMLTLNILLFELFHVTNINI